MPAVTACKEADQRRDDVFVSGAVLQTTTEHPQRTERKLGLLRTTNMNNGYLTRYSEYSALLKMLLTHHVRRPQNSSLESFRRQTKKGNLEHKTTSGANFSKRLVES